MVTSRILARRRVDAAAATPGIRRRRSRRAVGLPRAPYAGAAAARLRLSTFGRVYAVAAVVISMAVCYLVVAAQTTSTSYEINRLQAQQAELHAEQDALRYQQVTLHTPAKVQQQAATAGLVPAAPSKYISYQPVAIDLQAPIGDPPVDSSPLWAKAVAGVLTGLGVTHDVAASDR